MRRHIGPSFVLGGASDEDSLLFRHHAFLQFLATHSHLHPMQRDDVLSSLRLPSPSASGGAIPSLTAMVEDFSHRHASNPWWVSLLHGCNPLSAPSSGSTHSTGTPREGFAPKAPERASSGSVLFGAHGGGAMVPTTPGARSTGMRWSRNGWSGEIGLDTLFESSSEDDEVLTWEAEKLGKIRTRRIRKIQAHRERALGKSSASGAGGRHRRGRIASAASSEDGDPANNRSSRIPSECESPDHRPEKRGDASPSRSSCETVTEHLLRIGKQSCLTLQPHSTAPAHASAAGGGGMEANEKPSGLSVEEQEALQYSSDENVEMEGEVDCLARDKLAVYYPSELQWGSMFGPWPAAPMPAVVKQSPSAFPCNHPYYSREAIYPPDSFVPPVVSRAVVLPPRADPYFSFRFRQVLQRLIHDTDEDIKSKACAEWKVATPPAVRWSVVLRDIEMGGNFPSQLAQTLARLPQIRALTFTNSRRRVAQNDAILSILRWSPPWVDWLTFDNALAPNGTELVCTFIADRWEVCRKWFVDHPGSATAPLGVLGLALRNQGLTPADLTKLQKLLALSCFASIRDHGPMSDAGSIISGSTLHEEMDDASMDRRNSSTFSRRVSESSISSARSVTGEPGNLQPGSRPASVQADSGMTPEILKLLMPSNPSGTPTLPPAGPPKPLSMTGSMTLMTPPAITSKTSAAASAASAPGSSGPASLAASPCDPTIIPPLPCPASKLGGEDARLWEDTRMQVFYPDVESVAVPHDGGPVGAPLTYNIPKKCATEDATPGGKQQLQRWESLYGIPRLLHGRSVHFGLRWLDLSGNGLRDAGVALVLRSVANSATLCALDVSRNDVGKVQQCSALLVC